MKSHAKAPSAGSSMRQGSRLGRSGIVVAFALALVAFCGIGASSALAATAPTVSGETASEVGVTTAKLSGEVNPNGELGSAPTSWRIEYSLEGSGTWNVANNGTIEGAEASSHPAPGEEANPVTVEAIFGYGGELEPGKTYEFRLVAERGAETAETATPYPTLTMHAASEPALATSATTGIGYTLATLHGTIDPQGGNFNPIGSEAFWIYWQLQYAPENEAGEPEYWSNGAEGWLEGSEALTEGPIAEEAQLAPGTLQPGRHYLVRMHANYWNWAKEAESPQPFETFQALAAAAPTPAIEPVTAIGSTTATFNGTVNPNAPASEAEIEAMKAGSAAEVREAEDLEAAFGTSWHFECAPPHECGGPSGAALAAADSAHAVQAEATGLEPNTTYTVKLLAENRGGSAEATEHAGQPVTFTTEAVPPTLMAGTNTPQSDTVDLVRGWVNPKNSEVTSCVFRYGLDESFSSEAPCQSLPPTNNEPDEVTARVTGLEAGKTYNFKVTATSAAGPGESEVSVFAPFQAAEPESCPNEARRVEQHSTYLPDCRAYEMVSPPDKNGGDVIGDSARTQAEAGGNGATFTSLSAFAEPKGTGVATEYMSLRDGEAGNTGWRTHAISPPQESLTPGALLQGLDPLWSGNFSPDLSHGVFSAWSPLTNDPSVAAVQNLYVGSSLRSSSAQYGLVTACPLCAQTGPLSISSFVEYGTDQPVFDGASEDFSHVLFESPFRLTDEVTGEGPWLYESENGTVRAAGVLPNGEIASASVAARPGAVGRGNYTLSVINASGSRYFFQTNIRSGVGECGVVFPTCGQIYMRTHNGGPDAETVKLNESEKTNGPSSARRAVFMTATPDGNHIFFTSKQALTNDAPPQAVKLYEYDATKPASDPHNLTLIANPTAAGHPVDVSSVIGTSASGETVYFTTGQGRLLPNAPEVNPPFYEWHRGVLRYIGGLGPGEDIARNGGYNDGWTQVGARLQAHVSPDGQHLLFLSTGGEALTGYDHGHACSFNADLAQGFEKPCVELYVYDAATESLTCATCDPGGAPAESDGVDSVRQATGGTATNSHVSYALSEDGRYVFFSTRQSLIPEDTNGYIDAYEYDTETGEVHLLSSGTDKADSWFLDASHSGRDVFFGTAQRLLGWDGDQNVDLYDARVGGGLPEPAPTPATCEEDSCYAPVPPEPATPPAGSSSFAGPSNRHPKRHHHHHRRHRHRRHHHRSHRPSMRAGG